MLDSIEQDHFVANLERFEDTLKGLLNTPDNEEDEVEMGIYKEEKREVNHPIDSTLEEITPKDISPCNVCQDEFPSKKELIEHEKESDHGYTLSCKICEKKFFKKYTLKSHEECIQSEYKQLMWTM